MANFAKLNENNVVLHVEHVDNINILDSNGLEQEDIGIEYLKQIHGWPLWKKTSYNTVGGKYLLEDQSKAFRKNLAGMGFIYDVNKDAFIPPKPIGLDSHILHKESCLWEPPIPRPEPSYDNQGNLIRTYWDENTLSWKKEI